MLAGDELNNRFLVWLSDVATARLDQDAVADMVPSGIRHGRVVHAHRLTVFADPDAGVVDAGFTGD